MEYEFWGSYLIVHVGKELDHHHTEILQKGMNRVGKQRGYKNLIFDFTNTHFMDSSGVGMIIGRYKYLSMYGGSVFVVGLSPALEKLFYVSGLHKIIRTFSKMEDVFNEK